MRCDEAVWDSWVKDSSETQECMQYTHRAELYSPRAKPVNSQEKNARGAPRLEMHQTSARQVLHRFEGLQGLVKVAPRDAGVLSRQGLRPHPFAIRNGLHDQAVL